MKHLMLAIAVSTFSLAASAAAPECSVRQGIAQMNAAEVKQHLEAEHGYRDLEVTAAGSCYKAVGKDNRGFGVSMYLHPEGAYRIKGQRI